MVKSKDLSEEDTITIFREYVKNNSIIPSIGEIIFISWMIGWWYLEIIRWFWWVVLGFFSMGVIFYFFNGVPSYLYILIKELKRRGYGK